MGGGQLGRMMALAGRPLGLRFRFLEEKSPSPVDEMGERVHGAYDDPEALDAFAEGLDVVTYEFENVPAASTDRLEGRVPLHPSPSALAMAQDRLREKEGFGAHGIPTAPYRTVDSRQDLQDAVDDLGLPAILKTRRFGYDGKGQAVVKVESGLQGLWQSLGEVPLIAEKFVDFDREVSIIGTRSVSGSVAHYPLSENAHREGILFPGRGPVVVLHCRERLDTAAAGLLRPGLPREQLLVAGMIEHEDTELVAQRGFPGELLFDFGDNATLIV